jgi:hypothetical protein
MRGQRIRTATHPSEPISSARNEPSTAADQTAAFARLYHHFFSNADTDGPVLGPTPALLSELVSDLDPMLTNSASRSSSHRAFQDSIINIDGLNKRSTASNYDSQISTMSRESWNFTRVTGMPSGKPERISTHIRETCQTAKYLASTLEVFLWRDAFLMCIPRAFVRFAIVMEGTCREDLTTFLGNES